MTLSRFSRAASIIFHYLTDALARLTPRMFAAWLLAGLLAGALARLCARKSASRGAAAALAFLLTAYLCAVFTVTVYIRKPAAQIRVLPELFWSYRAIREGRHSLIGEVFWNVAFFIPAGFLLALALRRRLWRVPLLAFLLSLTIELAQLVLRRGFFELDDLFHNTLGALLGLALFLPLRAFLRSRDRL